MHVLLLMGRRCLSSSSPSASMLLSTFQVPIVSPLYPKILCVHSPSTKKSRTLTLSRHSISTIPEAVDVVLNYCFAYDQIHVKTVQQLFIQCHQTLNFSWGLTTVLTTLLIRTLWAPFYCLMRRNLQASLAFQQFQRNEIPNIKKIVHQLAIQHRLSPQRQMDLQVNLMEQFEVKMCKQMQCHPNLNKYFLCSHFITWITTTFGFRSLWMDTSVPHGVIISLANSGLMETSVVLPVALWVVAVASYEFNVMTALLYRPETTALTRGYQCMRGASLLLITGMLYISLQCPSLLVILWLTSSIHTLFLHIFLEIPVVRRLCRFPDLVNKKTNEKYQVTWNRVREVFRIMYLRKRTGSS